MAVDVERLDDLLSRTLDELRPAKLSGQPVHLDALIDQVRVCIRLPAALKC